VPAFVADGMTEPSAAQSRYWDVSERLALAELELAQARAEHEAFRREHDGELFLVFRPEYIAAAFAEDVRPLFGNKP